MSTQGQEEFNDVLAQITKSDHSIVFNGVNKILDLWGCSTAERVNILAISSSALQRYKKDGATPSLNRDHVERLSYIINIHQALRIVFSNSENVYGFMKMKNHNAFFNGNTPLSLIAQGGFGTLYEVFKRIDAMRNGQW